MKTVAEARVTRSVALADKPAEDLTSTQQRANKEGGKSGERDFCAMSTRELQRVAVADANLVVNLATKSRNLKGTFQRAMKEAAASLQGIVTTLAGRQQTEETARLEVENQRLQDEIRELKEEMAAVRGSLDSLRCETRRVSPRSSPLIRGLARQLEDEAVFVPPSPPRGGDKRPAEGIRPGAGGTEEERLEKIMGRVMAQMGVMISVRFEAIEGRLLPEKPLRPPPSERTEWGQPEVKLAWTPPEDLHPVEEKAVKPLPRKTRGAEPGCQLEHWLMTPS